MKINCRYPDLSILANGGWKYCIEISTWKDPVTGIYHKTPMAIVIERNRRKENSRCMTF